MTVPHASSYRKGDNIFVFYRMDKKCQAGRKYVAALDQWQGAYRPRAGISEGWVPARVASDANKACGSNAGKVQIEYRWPHFYTKNGRLTDADSGWKEWYALADVRTAPDIRNANVPLSLTLPDSSPELAIIAFRWGGQNEIGHCAQWGETGISASDRFFECFTDQALMPQLGRKYEVWTVYIEDLSDMVKIADSAHIMFGTHHPARRAQHTCAMYFLYPTAFEERCIPTQETGSDGGAGLIDQKSFFRMKKSVERCGIPTRFPHCEPLYEQLVSKRWTHQLSLTPHLRVIPSVGVPRSLLETGCEHAASLALATLDKVKKQQALLRGEPVPQRSIDKGVAKLGFSWEALDVKYWEFEDGLKTALYQLTQAIEISDELTAQPHDSEALIVQEYIKHDLELRLYVVEGKIEGSIFTKFCRIKDNLEFGDFEQTFIPKQAATDWMGGDIAALEDGDQQCRELVGHWLAWIEAQTCEIPPAVRFDFFVGRSEKPGKATVWTLEICELGFSMLGHKELPRKVFQAMLQSCLNGPNRSGIVEQPDVKRRRLAEEA